MKLLKTLAVMAAFVCGNLSAQAQIVAPEHLSDTHTMLRVNPTQRFLLIPVEEKEENAHIDVICNNHIVKSFNVRLAVDKVDYCVPLDIQTLRNGENEKLLLDITFHGDRHKTGSVKNFVCWKDMKLSDSFDKTNREQYRPAYHHTPAYAWMNDPNGMFYKDGVWHLYFQYNPYGSQWENMTWGHSISTDLIHWTQQPDAIEMDALGQIFSGSAVVDKNNTAGFGKDAIIAMYTSAGQHQTQSIAYSTDGGKTFTKYAGNPVLTFAAPDFRDPKVFWHEGTQRWIVVLAVGQEVQFYSSKNLKEWKYESSFGHGYGNHDGVWECPDLLEMSNGENAKKSNSWVLLLNINPGGPFGGSATQYFTGMFDGHQFVCDSKPETTKWMDYGKDHYATVSFSNAPENRKVALAWMSNWQYANQVPTKQFRSANSVPRDLKLFRDGDENYLASIPSPEMMAARGQQIKKPTNTCEIVVDVKGSASIVLSNKKGEQVVMNYDEADRTFTMDRTQSGLTDFSDAFPVETKAPTHGVIRQLRIFVDRCSIEAFDSEGKMVMTNLVFPTEPYTQVKVKGGKAKVFEIKN
jgi:levanase/fructan beta-fructosidase